MKCAQGKSKVKVQKGYWKERKNKEEFMDGVYGRKGYKSFDDWQLLSKAVLVKEGGEVLYHQYFSLSSLLSSIYPNYPWPPSFKQYNRNTSEDGVGKKVKVKKTNWKKKEEQEEFLSTLYQSLHLTGLDDWVRKVGKKGIVNGGGKRLFKEYSSLSSMLTTIYPHYPWSFPPPRKPAFYWSSLSHRTSFLLSLYQSLHFTSMDHWRLLTRKKVKQEGGEVLLKQFPSLPLLLRDVFPHYPWPPFSPHPSDNDNNNNTINNTHNDEMEYDYSNKDKEEIEEEWKRKPKGYWRSLANQRRFMKKMFQRMGLKRLDDWLAYSLSDLIKGGGGGSWIPLYYSSFPHLLSSIYPYHPWRFPHHRIPNGYWRSLDHQRSFMTSLFHSLHLTSEEDWKEYDMKTIKQYGGRGLAEYYKGVYAHLLSAIYPPLSSLWATLLPISPSSSLSLHRISRFILFLQTTYLITCKREWYRVVPSLPSYLRHNRKDWGNDSHSNCYTIDNNNINNIHNDINNDINKGRRGGGGRKEWMGGGSDNEMLCKYLRLVHADEEWEGKRFTMRWKKTTQLWLKRSLRLLFPSSLLIEDYHHPLLPSTSHLNLELDIYLPQLNLAVEYQGRQHYDDLPAAFSSLESYQSRDTLKISLCSLHHISLLFIPFWWDLSFSSLHSTLLHFLNHKL